LFVCLFVANGDISFGSLDPTSLLKWWCTHTHCIDSIVIFFSFGPCCRLLVGVQFWHPHQLYCIVLLTSFQIALLFMFCIPFRMNTHTVSILLWLSPIACLFLSQLVWTHHNNSWFHHLPNTCRVSFDSYPACFCRLHLKWHCCCFCCRCCSHLKTHDQTPKMFWLT
jgi:hypothetical protein